MSTLEKVAYNIAEAAAACGVSEATIRRAAKSHALLGKRTGENGGGPYLFSRADLEAWVDGLADA